MKSDEIKQLLQQSMPVDKLLFPSCEQESWWEQVRQAEAYRPMIDEIRAEAALLLDQTAPALSYSLFRIFKDRGTRLEYERVYFEMRKRLNTFAIMSLLEPEREDYQSALEETLWSICNEYTWSLPAHVNTTTESTVETEYSVQKPSEAIAGNAGAIDLFSAETGFALSEILRLTEHRLPLLLRNRIRHEVYRRIFWPFIHQGPFHWETASHNWAAVCAGSIGAAALHLIKDQDDLSIILERVLQAMNHYLSGFKSDGATTEGYGYWYYGFGFFVFFADLLKVKTGGALSLFSDEKIHQIALFQQKCFLCGTSVVNFSDSQPESHIHMGLTHYLNRMYPDVELPEFALRTSYTEDHCNRWGTAFRNLLWFQEDKAANGAPWGPATYFLEDSQWLISRHADEIGMYCFAAKGGHNAEPHNHNDVGHFILHYEGETFLADLGCGMYTKEYFGAERYSYLCNGAQGHSVPVINGRLQQAGAEYRAREVSCYSDGDTIHYEMELSAAYGADAQIKLLKRSFAWERTEKPVLTLTDTFEFTGTPDEITERFVTVLEPVMADGKLTIPGKEQRLIVSYDPDVLEPHIHKLEYADHYGVMKDVYAIEMKLRHPSQQCSAVVQFQFES
ncbi:hypothetical protein DVH26_16465 [Paenibacillus sp. H1-7]|uniref:heparinase II/III family protein n=1 Tax=Paenibacillus sp. H1-7 TaxID=2282849 RepID=UPI001EF84A8A|nr:heparinase II/III family protein [Paenibacillus sp. H1-7]ULL15895.1 hypothetical protein DVH26_16465 [Paenibacillus sp. H1-7]